jgi:hypothetical protein
MVVQAWAQPYETTMINVLDMTAMAAVFATRLGAILYDHFDPYEPGLPVCAEERVVVDLGCKGGRLKLGLANGFVLIGIQVLLVLLFAVVMAKEKLYELFFAPKKMKKMKKCWRKCVGKCGGRSKKTKTKKIEIKSVSAEHGSDETGASSESSATGTDDSDADSGPEEHSAVGRAAAKHRSPSAFVYNNPISTHAEGMI